MTWHLHPPIGSKPLIPCRRSWTKPSQSLAHPQYYPLPTPKYAYHFNIYLLPLFYEKRHWFAWTENRSSNQVGQGYLGFLPVPYLVFTPSDMSLWEGWCHLSLTSTLTPTYLTKLHSDRKYHVSVVNSKQTKFELWAYLVTHSLTPSMSITTTTTMTTMKTYHPGQLGLPHLHPRLLKERHPQHSTPHTRGHQGKNWPLKYIVN